jgi:hypothetical protein
MAGKRRPSAYTQIISEQQKEPPENQQLGEVLQSDNTTISQSDNIVKSANDKVISSQSDSIIKSVDDKDILSQNDNIVLPESDIPVKSANDKSTISQNDTMVTSQQDTVSLSQNDIPIFPQSGLGTPQEKKRKSTERERLTYYLDPYQVDKLEDMRTAYRRATGKRLNEQELMRLIIDRLELSMLL